MTTPAVASATTNSILQTIWNKIRSVVNALGSVDRVWTDAEISTATARPGNSLARRSPTGYLAANYFNSGSTDLTAQAGNVAFRSTDGYIRTISDPRLRDLVQAQGIVSTQVTHRTMPANLHNWIPFGSAGMFIGEGAHITNAPDADWWRYIGISHSNPEGYITLLAMPFHGSSRLLIKTCANGSWTGWKEFADAAHTHGVSFTLSGTTLTITTTPTGNKSL